MACVWEEADGQGALLASVLRALHTTTETEHKLPHTHQHKAEAGGIIPPRFMTIYARAAASQSVIATRLISDDGGLATGTGMTDHAGRLLGRLHMGLALLGETDGGRFHGRISGLGLSTDYDFGEPEERWQQSDSGASTLIFVLRPATTCSDETVDMITVGSQTFGQDGLEAHGRPKEVCLFEGLPPKKIEKNNSSAREIFTEVTSALTGRGRAAAAQTEGVRRCYSVAHPWLANAHVQEQRLHGTGDVGRTDTAHQARTGRRTEGPSQSVDGITSLVCSLTSHGVWTHISCLFLPLHRRLQLPCWEAQFSDRWSLASPALCWDSDDHRLASTRGTPGSSIQSAVPLQKMGMPSTVVLRADAAVLLDWILTPEAAYSQLSNLPIDVRFDTMSLGWALFCDYVGANFTFWKHCNLFQRQKWHEHSWEALSVGRWAGPASCWVSDSHSAARARDPSLWFARYRPAFQELMDAEASYMPECS